MAALAIAGCFGDSTGPRSGTRSAFGFRPAFRVASAGHLVDFTSVRIVLKKPGTSTIALDTTAAFPASADTLRLPLSVVLDAGVTSEDFDLTLALVNAAGDTVFRGGPVPVTVTAGLTGTIAPAVPLTYVGIGANAAGVRFVTTPATVFYGDTAVFAAQAFDSANQPIPGTPMAYGINPLDSTTAGVPDLTAGRVVAKAHRGSARVVAQLLTGQTVTATLAVQPKPAAVVVTGGNAQTGPVSAALAQPITVRVKAADSLGVAGVTVNFAVAPGGGSLTTPSAITDTAGYASVGWTLGPAAGPQAMTATLSGLTPANITATANVTAAITLSVPGGLVGTGVGGFLIIKLNPAAPAGGVTVTLTSDSTQHLTVAPPGTVAFAAGDTVQVAGLAGVAAGVSILHGTATGYGAGTTTVAVVPNFILVQAPFSVGAGQSTSFSITLVPAAPAGGLTVGLLSSDTTKVKVTTPTVNFAAGQSVGGGTVQGVAAGAAAVTAVATGYALGATVVTVSGAATTLTLVSGGSQSAAASTQLPQPIVAKVLDALGNGVSGQTVAFAVATGGGSVGTPSATTDANGLATTTWTLGSLSGTQTMMVTAAGLANSPITVSATATGGIASTTVTPLLDTLTALTATVQLAAQAKDALGANTAGNFTWTSRTPAFATVSASGLVTAVANGSTYVVATEAGGTADSALIVVQQKLATINVTPANRSIYLGANYTFAAAAVDGLGKPMPGITAFTWSSTAPAVGSVDTAGHVVGAGLGTAQIKATSGAVTGVANVSVLTPITRIAVVVDTVGAAKTDTFSLPSLGITRRYRAIAHDTLDAVMPGILFTWAASNPSVAVVPNQTSDTATATSAANGVTTINATAQGFTSNPGALLTVAQVLSAIQLSAPASNPSAVIAATGTIGLMARGLDANSRYIAGGTFTYASSNPAIATVNAGSGVVTGVAAGHDTITATSGAITSNPLDVTVGGAVPAIISFGRDTVSVGRGGNASIPILLSKPAASPLIVKLVVADTFANWSTPTVTIPAGQTSVNATLNGHNAGTTTVTASDSSGLGYTSGTAVAKVTANMRLTSGGYGINATDVVSTQVLLSDPSPAGGTYVTFVYGTPGIAATSPDPAFIPAGQLAADVQIRGLAAGTTSITPNAIGVNGSASSFTVYAPVLSPSTSLILLGQGQYQPNVNVQVPAYTNLPVPLTITSSDTTLVTVPPLVTIPSNSYYVFFTTTANQLGTATLTLASPGWTASTPITVISTTPRVGICCSATYNTTSPQTTVTLYAEDSTRTAHYRTNSLVVHVTPRDPTVMQVLDTVVTINPGQQSATSRIVPGGLGGTTWLVATASGHQPDSVLYTVVGPKLQFSFVHNHVGAGQYDANVNIQTPDYLTAPLIVSVNNSNPAAVTTPSADTLPKGLYYRFFTVAGITPDTATLLASAPGYTPDTALYTVTSPRLTACCTTTLNNFGPGTNVTVYTTDTLRTAHLRLAPLSVSVVSTDPSVVTVDSTVVTVDSGANSNGRAHLTPVGPGVARIIFTAAGHVTLDTLTITVQTPKLGFSFTSALLGRRQHFNTNNNGFNIQTPDYRTSPLAVTITQKNTAVDTLTATVPTIPASSYYVYLDAYGLANGTDTLIATAPGYNPDTAFITVTTPKFTNCCMPGSTTTTNPPIGITVYTADSAGSVHAASDTIVVTALVSDSTVLQPTQQYFRALKNTTGTNTTLNVVGPGTASVTYSDSAGTGYLPTTTGTVTVTGPSLSFPASSGVLGMRQNSGPTAYNVQVPNYLATPLVVNLVSTDPRVVTVPASVTIPANSYYAYFTATGMDTLGTIQIQATATGYKAASMSMQVTVPKFTISTSTQLNTTSAPAGITVNATDANGTPHPATEDVTVTLASSAPNVAAIDSATVTIPAGSSFNNHAKWRSGTPDLVGTSQLSATDTRSALYKYNTGTVNVAVIEPSLAFGGAPGALGIGQYRDYINVQVPDYAAASFSVSFTHTGTARAGTFTNQTNTPITGVTINSATYYTYFRMSGLVRGTDTLTASATSPAHNPATVYTVVDSGRVDPLSGWPGTLSMSGTDSALITLYARDPNTNTGPYEVSAAQFTLAPNANIEFHRGGAVVTSVTIPADAQYVQFYVVGLSAGTGSVTITNANSKTYTNSVTVTP